MKGIAFFAVFFISFATHAQRTDVHNGMIFIDGKPTALIDRSGCGFANNCRVTLSNTDGRTAIIIKYNPTSFGGHTYAEVHFIKPNTFAKVEDLSSKEGKIAKLIVKEKFFVNGDLNEEAAAAYVKKNPQ